MVMYEGKGLSIPPADIVSVGDHEMRCIIESSRELNHYSARTDAWGRGLLGSTSLGMRLSLSRQEIPIVAGKIGEYAVHRKIPKRLHHLAPEVDFRRRSGGDGGRDLLIGSLSIQVKTRVSSRRNLVKIQGDPNKPPPLVGHAHVFCSWDGNTESTVQVLGWIENRELALMPKEQSSFGPWWNYVVADGVLLPMRRLWAWVEGRQK